MRAMIIGAVALAAIAFVACGGDDDEPLRNADEVRDEQQQEDRTKAEAEAQPVGTPIELNNDVRVTLRGAERRTAAEMGGRAPSAPDTAWLVLDLLIENRSDAEQSPPDVNVDCADGSAGHWYLDDDPDALSIKPLPAKTQDEGRKLFGIPDGCEPIVRTNATGVIVGDQVTGRWKIVIDSSEEGDAAASQSSIERDLVEYIEAAVDEYGTAFGCLLAGSEGASTEPLRYLGLSADGWATATIGSIDGRYYSVLYPTVEGKLGGGELERVEGDGWVCFRPGG